MAVHKFPEMWMATTASVFGISVQNDARVFGMKNEILPKNIYAVCLRIGFLWFVAHIKKVLNHTQHTTCMCTADIHHLSSICLTHSRFARANVNDII